VTEARIPSGIKGFLFGRLLNRYSGATPVSSVSGPMSEALLRTLAFEHRYERSEYLEDLQLATGFLSTYLIRPRKSLLRWIFGPHVEAPGATLQGKLLHVTNYRYLTLLLEAWIEKHRMTTVSEEQLESLIADIDNRVVARHSDPELVLLARPIFGFALFGATTPNPEVPLETLREFYLEKNLDTFWGQVEQGLAGARTVGFSALMTCVKGFRNTSAKPAEVSPPEIQPAQVEQPEPVQTRSEETEPVFVPNSSQLPDLVDFISDDKKEVFVKAVFEHDSAYYTAVIASLNSIATWKEAALFLSQFYQTNGLDPFADEVVEFTDAIHDRYEGVVRR